MYKTLEFQYRMTGPDINLGTGAPAGQLPAFIISDVNEFKRYEFLPVHIGAVSDPN
jgi:hypothetical protein